MKADEVEVASDQHPDESSNVPVVQAFLRSPRQP